MFDIIEFIEYINNMGNKKNRNEARPETFAKRVYSPGL